MTKKVALLLSGRPGEYKECFSRLKSHLLDRLDIDTFIYCSTDKEGGKIIEELYRPKVLKIEESDPPSISLPAHIKAPETSIDSTLHMTRKIHECFKLIDGHYDWVIKFRFDCAMGGPQIFNKKLLDKLNPKLYYIPSGGDWRDGLNDSFCLSSQENMEHYCNLYNMIPKYLNDCLLHQELLLRKHLTGRNVARFKCPIFLRKKYSDTSQIEERLHNPCESNRDMFTK